MIDRLPASLSSLSIEERRLILAVLDRMLGLPGVKCVFLGGSLSLGAAPEPGADVDLWVVVLAPSLAKAALRTSLSDTEGIRVAHDAGHLPWLGELLTLFCLDGCRFSIDVGLCAEDDFPNLNPGPSPVLIWGDPDLLRRLPPVQRYCVSAEVRAHRILANMVKARKSLLRGYLWNAIECMHRARREVMGMLRDTRATPQIDYGRPDRDIEHHISRQEQAALAGTCAPYASGSVAAGIAAIASLALDWASEHLSESVQEALRELLHWMVRHASSR